MKVFDGFLIVVLSAIAFFFQDWVPQKIDNRVSVEFPFKPAMQNLQGKTFFVAEIPADRFKCSITALDLSPQGLDSASLAQIFQQPDGLEALVNGILSMNKGLTEGSKKAIIVKGYPAFDAVFNAGAELKESKKFDKMYVRGIAVGTTMYTFFVTCSDSKLHPEIRERFFNSIVVGESAQ